MPSSFGEYDGKHLVAHDAFPALPCYISSRSADVILSDVRPTKLSIDALESINAFLDELLHTILSAARALTTTQLRAGLHKVLPTTLGKEAVLEAELELRAYWERTGGIPEVGSSLVVVEDSTFNLEWTFELLRLKCEAYSTLSDTDENSDAETRLFQRMSAQGSSPPKQTLLAPASLYLTAIIESICEHIVSNVGRVAARDSSRAVATGQDLFIALCEDSSIYGLFKNMSVYGQIEALSKTPRSSRRSMSLAHEGDTPPFRRNGSRLSSESNVPVSTINSSRPSVDRSRSVRTLYNKVSQDFVSGSDPGHRKMDSFASANTKQSLASKSDRSPISPTFSEDTRSLEFDDMMRSGSTMKVSLTPDRLRTMEVLNKERARASQQKVLPKAEKSNGIISHPFPEQANRKNGSTPIIRRAGSIIGSEDDRSMHKPPPPSRPRQLSAATASGHTVSSLTRVRASSTTADPSAAPSNTFSNKHTFSDSTSAVPDQRPASGVTSRKKALPHELDLNAAQPSRARIVTSSKESLNLEDVMAGPDDDGMGELKPFVSSKQRDRQRGFSSSTKELIAFLSEGPPELSPGDNSPSLSMPKKSGRLQKMISRITLASDTARPPRKLTVGSGDPSSKSMTNLSPLANRPIPPRYPTSGPSSATSSERDSADQARTGRQRVHSFVQRPPLPSDSKSIEREPTTSAPSPIAGIEEGLPVTTTPIPVILRKSLEKDILQHVQPVMSLASPTSLAIASATELVSANAPAVQPSPLSSTVPQCATFSTTSSLHQKVPSPPAPRKSPPASSALEHAREMRMMLEHAASAAECRILVDMFLARSRLITDVADLRASPSPVDSEADRLEGAIVELFLGDAEPLFGAAVVPSISSANRSGRTGKTR